MTFVAVINAILGSAMNFSYLRDQGHKSTGVIFRYIGVIAESVANYCLSRKYVQTSGSRVKCVVIENERKEAWVTNRLHLQ
jgi:hypothetical protein